MRRMGLPRKPTKLQVSTQVDLWGRQQPAPSWKDDGYLPGATTHSMLTNAHT